MWRHAAKQLDDGRWSSELGELEDVTHANAEDVSGRCYGAVACLMRRRIQDKARPGHPASLSEFGIIASPADHPLTVIKGVNSATGRTIPALVSVSTTGPIPL